MSENTLRKSSWPLIGVSVGLLGVLLLFWPLLNQVPSRTLWADNFDGLLIYWIFEWGYHALREGANFSDFWNANSFFPHSNTLAFSESLITGQVFYAPFRAMGFAPLEAIYLSLIAFTLLGTIALDHALIQLEFQWSERILCIFVACFSMTATSFLYHYQIFGFLLVPACMMYFYLWLTKKETKFLFLTGVTYSIASGLSTYLLVAVPLILIVPSLLVLVLEFREFKGSPLAFFRQWNVQKSFLLTAGFGVILYQGLVRPYLQVSKAMSLPSYEEISYYSANISSLLNGFSVNSLWYSPGVYSEGGWERAYFPGYILLVSMFIFIPIVAFTWSTRCKHLKINLLMVFVVSAFLWIWALSLGPFIKPWGIKGPLWFMSELVPGFRNIRAPGRFGFMLGLPLGLIVILLLRILLSQKQRLLKASSIFLGLLIAVESIPKFKTFELDLKNDLTYEFLGQRVQSNESLIIFPISGDDHYKTIVNMMHQLIGSTHHWARLVVGYGARTTPQLSELIYIEQQISAGNFDFDRLMEFTRQNKINYLLILKDQVQPKFREAMEHFLVTKAMDPILVNEHFLIDLGSIAKEHLDVSTRSPAPNLKLEPAHR